MTAPVKFVDAHHHLWIPESQSPDLGYRWLRDIGAMKPFGDPTAIQRNYEWSEFVAESSLHHLLGSVYLQVDGAIADPVAETAWVQSVFSESSLAHAIVGLVDLSSGNAQTVIEQQMQCDCFRGVRQILSRMDNNPALSFAPEHYLRNPKWRDQFQLLSDHGLSFDLQLYPEQMTEAAEFLSRYPNVNVVLDHAGSPIDQTSTGLDMWREGMAELATLPQVAIKLCGFGMFDAHRSAASIRPLVETSIELFGSDRVMFASNFPVDKLMGSYDEAIDMVSSGMSLLSAAEQRAVWFGNAARIYRLGNLS